MIASREIQKRRQEHSRGGGVTARRLADFLLSIESEEALLEQRLRDRQRTAMGGGNVTEHPLLSEAVEQNPSCPDADPDYSDITTDLLAYAEF